MYNHTDINLVVTCDGANIATTTSQIDIEYNIGDSPFTIDVSQLFMS
jgi:hypothetical protein